MVRNVMRGSRGVVGFYRFHMRKGRVANRSAKAVLVSRSGRALKAAF